MNTKFRVKEFAELSGVTVRTLQYYDRMGLLKPSSYTNSNHRIYRIDDLLRLQQILTFKYLGYGLAVIRTLMDSPEYDVGEALRTQRRAIGERIGQLQRVAKSIDRTVDAMDSLSSEELDEAKAEAFKRFDHRTVVLAAACRVARELAPGARLAVAGHSEGSVVASLMCANPRDVLVDACISLSGPAYRFYDLMLRGAERRAIDGIVHFGSTAIPLDLYGKAIDVARNGSPLPDELKTLPFGFHTMDPDSQRYLREYDSVDNSEMIAKVDCPVLIVQGGDDMSVWSENGEVLVAARRQSAGSTESAFLPDLDHFYKKAGANTVDERVSAAIADWLDRCLN